MVLAMPGADRSWLASLDAGGVEDLTRDGKLIEERPFRFECGCSPRKMIRALWSIYENNLDDLFRGDPAVEASCPRCGRRWWINRDQLEKSDSASGDPSER
jgi:redox-regulated HSP33 family molecular chaperone